MVILTATIQPLSDVGCVHVREKKRPVSGSGVSSGITIYEVSLCCTRHHGLTKTWGDQNKQSI